MIYLIFSNCPKWTILLNIIISNKKIPKFSPPKLNDNFYFSLHHHNIDDNYYFLHIFL